jgi:hypothetical protein
VKTGCLESALRKSERDREAGREREREREREGEENGVYVQVQTFGFERTHLHRNKTFYVPRYALKILRTSLSLARGFHLNFWPFKSN